MTRILELRRTLAQEAHRRQSLERRHVARARHDHVRVPAAVVARPFPDADAGGAVLDGGAHVEILELGLLAGHDHVHVVAAPQAVIRDGQQGVGVRREIDPDHVRFLVDDVIDEPGVLVREPVVVLPPDVGRQQVVQGRDGPPPGNLPGHLEPLRVLVEHRGHDVDERLVAGEEAVPPGEEVPLEPSLAGMLAQDLHHPAVGAQLFVIGDAIGHPGSVGDLEQRVEAVGRGLVGPEHAEVPPLEIAPHHVPQEPAENPRGLPDDRPGARDGDGVVLRSSAGRDPVAAGRRWHAHWRSCAAGPRGPIAPGPARGLRARRTAPPPDSSSSIARAASRGPAAWPSPRAAPGANARILRSSCRPPPWARSTPWGCAG